MESTKLKRRRFLEVTGLGSTAVWCHSLEIVRASDKIGRAECRADVVIVGAGLGGCAAALSALRNGCTVILTEPTDWIGGQLTQQAVPPDEHAWVESTGAPAAYRQFRNMVRDFYRRNYPLSEAARNNPTLNPGNGSVSRLCHEPRVALAVLGEMLAAHLSTGKLTLLLNCQPHSALVDGDRIESIQVQTAGGLVTLAAKLFIDASEQGDLLPLAKVEYVIGAEARGETDEPHAPMEANPRNIQSFAWCFAMDHVHGEDHTIARPSQYNFWRDHIPALTPPWSGKLLSLEYSNPRTLEPRQLAFVPPIGSQPPPRTANLNLWLYRRIQDPSNYTPGGFGSGATIVNWPQNDYMLGNIIADQAHDASGADQAAAEVAKHMEGGRQLSLSLLYWLQTEAPRPDGGTGWSGLRLRRDMVGTEDGLAKFPYIRESRRIRAEFTILEQHLSKEIRSKIAKTQGTTPVAAPFSDSVGIGYYHLDLHPSSGGDNYIDFESLPFQIPLGALIPRRVDNLLAANKNIGTTHISNGCYRLHPVEWSIGEAAGALAAFAIERRESPRGIRNRAQALQDFQQRLQRQGVELQWSAKILNG